MEKPSNQTNKNTPNNRGKKSNKDVETELRSLWLSMPVGNLIRQNETRPSGIVS